jgi:hypothetical protein
VVDAEPKSGDQFRSGRCLVESGFVWNRQFIELELVEQLVIEQFFQLQFVVEFQQLIDWRWYADYWLLYLLGW